MSRFKSDPNQARGGGGVEPSEGRVPQAAPDGAGSEAAGATPPPPRSEPAGRAAPASERAGSGRYDPVWIPGTEPAVPTPLPEPPAIQLVHHELPGDATPDARLVMIRNPDSRRAASFRVLRHHILDAGAPQVIAVTSPRERERKTTCALNLAMALAEAGQARVLLVDGNRLRPELAQILRFVPPRCFLRQVEARRRDPSRAWRVVDMPELGIHVLGIDPESERRPLVDGPAFMLAFEGLRLAGYDHIVVDASSVLRSADLNLLQDAVDSVLLTVVQRRSTARDVQNAVEQLTPAKVLGTTLFER